MQKESFGTHAGKLERSSLDTLQDKILNCQGQGGRCCEALGQLVLPGLFTSGNKPGNVLKCGMRAAKWVGTYTLPWGSTINGMTWRRVQCDPITLQDVATIPF